MNTYIKTDDIGLCNILFVCRDDLTSQDEFWFGTSFPLRCPNPSPSDIDCNNPVTGPGSWTIAERIFGVSNFDTSSLDSFVDVRFNSPAGNTSGQVVYLPSLRKFVI